MPKSAQDSKTSGKRDLLDPPLGDPFWESKLQEKVTWSKFFCGFFRFVFKVHFSLILAEFGDQNGGVFGGVDMLEVW